MPSLHFRPPEVSRTFALPRDVHGLACAMALIPQRHSFAAHRLRKTNTLAAAWRPPLGSHGAGRQASQSGATS
jgi:hypothetical protein